MKDIDVLKQAREQLKSQPIHLKDSYHEIVNGKHCYCLMGAIGAAFKQNEMDYVMLFKDDIHFAKVLGFSEMHEPFNYNDEHTKEEVITVLDTAIKKLEEQNNE